MDIKTVTVDQLTLESFVALLKNSFRVRLDDSQALDLQLVEVTHGKPNRQAESFSLLFSGPGEFLLPQQMYWFEHDQIGRFELFITPNGRETDGFRYEAVFNRLKKGI